MLESMNPTRDLEAMFSRAAKARKPFDIEWTLDCAFFVNRQYVEWRGPHGNSEGRFQDIPGRLDKFGRPQPRAVANKIYSLVMDAYAMVKQHDPAVEVLPQNVDSMELSNARVAQAYLEHLCFPTQADWRGRRDEALFWTVLVGEGWIKACMDERKGRPTIEARSPFSIYPDPTPSNYRDCRWIIDVQGMDPEEVYDRFGVEMAASDVDNQDVLKTKILREVGMLTGNPTVTVKELWELPGGKRYPKGRHVIWAAPEDPPAGGLPVRPRSAPVRADRALAAAGRRPLLQRHAHRAPAADGAEPVPHPEAAGAQEVQQLQGRDGLCP